MQSYASVTVNLCRPFIAKDGTEAHAVIQWETLPLCDSEHAPYDNVITGEPVTADIVGGQYHYVATVERLLTEHLGGNPLQEGWKSRCYPYLERTYSSTPKNPDMYVTIKLTQEEYERVQRLVNALQHTWTECKKRIKGIRHTNVLCRVSESAFWLYMKQDVNGVQRLKEIMVTE